MKKTIKKFILSMSMFTLLIVQVSGDTSQLNQLSYSNDLDQGTYTWGFTSYIIDNETITSIDDSTLYGSPLQGSEIDIIIQKDISNFNFDQLITENDGREYVEIFIDDNSILQESIDGMIYFFALIIETEIILENNSRVNLFKLRLESGNNGTGIFGDENVESGIENNQYFEKITSETLIWEKRWNINTGLVVLDYKWSISQKDFGQNLIYERKIELLTSDKNTQTTSLLPLNSFFAGTIPMMIFIVLIKRGHQLYIQ